MTNDSDDPKLGPTGQFPHGRIRQDDEGELRCAIYHKDGRVFMDFGTPTAWIGMYPEDALKLADALRDHARSA